MNRRGRRAAHHAPLSVRVAGCDVDPRVERVRLARAAA